MWSDLEPECPAGVRIWIKESLYLTQVSVRTVEILLDKSILGEMSPGQALWASCGIYRLALGYHRLPS